MVPTTAVTTLSSIERVEEAVERREHLGRRQAGHRVGADGAAHLPHQGRRRGTLAHDVAHAEEDASRRRARRRRTSRRRRRCRPRRPGTRRRAGGRRPRAASRGARLAAAPRRRRARAGTASALDRATPARLATSVASETSSASKSRPGPSMKVITPMTSPLAVSGTASAVETPCGSAPSSPPSSGASCVRPRAEGDGGRRVGCRRGGLLDAGAGADRPLAPVPGLAHVEPDEPALAGHLDRARVGQPALDEAHGPPDHRRGLEARAEEPGHLGEEGQALASRFRGAQRLPLVLEHLGPLERLRGEAGQGGEEAQIGLARLGVGHEGEGEDPERADAADERLADDRDRLGELVQHPGHDLGGQVVTDPLVRRRWWR